MTPQNYLSQIEPGTWREQMKFYAVRQELKSVHPMKLVAIGFFLGVNLAIAVVLVFPVILP